MEESIRLYWQGREAKLTPDAIPEADRKPLLVHRSVVQSHVPEAYRQLQEDRYFAIAWQSDGQIRMILCHPNVAKGPADNLCLDSRALPRLFLTLSGWEDAPAASRLLLTAFGSEAADVDQCEEARRALARWLTEHGQPEMAAVAKRFSTFPFGVKSDAFEVSKIWRRVVIEGKKEQIEQFLTQVERRFERLGWSRDRKREDQMNSAEYQQNHFYCWVGSPGTGPRVAIYLNRATDRRVRGGTYDAVDAEVDFSHLANTFQHVLKEVLEPAATAAGLEVSYPRIGPISQLGPTTTAAMTDLARAGVGKWSGADEMGPAWRRFVLTALREDATLKPEELTAWFIGSGWDDETAANLTKRFYADAAWLAEHEESGGQSACR